MRNLLVTAFVAVICGVMGAMGYLQLFGPTPGKPLDQSKNELGSSSQTKLRTGSRGEATSGSSNEAPASSASVAHQSSAPGLGSTDEASELKQRIVDLNQQIARLGERVDRLQELLSLTLPLLQRIAPKG